MGLTIAICLFIVALLYFVYQVVAYFKFLKDRSVRTRDQQERRCKC